MSTEEPFAAPDTPIYALGIDGGGTYTDAAVVELTGGSVSAFAKAQIGRAHV